MSAVEAEILDSFLSRLRSDEDVSVNLVDALQVLLEKPDLPTARKIMDVISDLGEEGTK